ncbi:hypothetical protein BS47DRAFT_1374065 [Hydnum rufescens UP504]|uniref:DDE Tnp4 domain-containing protein n=1 Tax=Hydnum rufescens UP504 TaxID=1448309 RepID=A0A9P6DMA0_9AGAM|nr:hypothetical protein BS47DRAFT_1374065 [Hydnum rufescens UP504]
MAECELCFVIVLHSLMLSISPHQKVILGVLDHAKSLQKHSITSCSTDSESNTSAGTSTSSSSSNTSSHSIRTDLNEVRTTAQQWYMRSMWQVLFPHEVEKAMQLGLVLIFYKEEDPFCFCCNLCVTAKAFDTLLSLIGNNLIFYSASNAKQLPIPYQLAITLYCFGHFGIAAGVEVVAQWVGCSVSVVVKSMHRVMLMEKKVAADWVELVLCAAWQPGFAMVDRTLIPLHCKPGHHGEQFFDHKCNYSLSLMLVTTPNLHIIDYILGPPGSVHNSMSFQESHTSIESAALFQEGEWLWADSAYGLTSWCVVPYKQPLSLIPSNHQFNYHLS